MNVQTGMKMVKGMAGMASLAGTLDTTLPSVMAAERLWTGQRNAVPAVGVSIGMRAVIIGIGLSIAGLRGKQVLFGSLASSAMIEAYVLAWTYNRVMARTQMPTPSPPPLPAAGLHGRF